MVTCDLSGPQAVHPHRVKSILIVRMNRIGDMVCTIPLVKTVRKAFPEAVLTVFADAANADVISSEPYVDEVLVFRKGSGIFANRYANIWRILAGKHYDLAIGVKGGYSTFLALTLAISGAALRLGYVSQRRPLMNRLLTLPVPPVDFSAMHQVDACLNLVSALGLQDPVRDVTVQIPPAFYRAACDFLQERGLVPGQRLAVFNVSSNRITATWSAGKFIELGRHLEQTYAMSVLVTGAGADAAKAREVCAGIGRKAHFYPTRHIMDFAALCACGNFLIAGEGGASHLGAAAGTAVICLFGDVNATVWRPYGERHVVLQGDGSAESIPVDQAAAAVAEKILSGQVKLN